MASPVTNSRTHRILFALVLAVLATAAGIWSASILLDRQAAPEGLEGTVFPVARRLPSFELVDQNNQVFNEASLRGKWSFLFFGYTHCPDVCPTTLSVLNSVAHRLRDIEDDLRFVFVSVDPDRDTPDVLARYVSYFNGDFVGVTGTEQQIGQLTGQLGILHMRVAAEGNSSDYLIDHTASVLLIDPDGRYHAVFSPPLTAESISEDFRKILKAYR